MGGASGLKPAIVGKVEANIARVEIVGKADATIASCSLKFGDVQASYLGSL